MFSQACVKNSVHRGRGVYGEGVHGGGGMHGSGECVMGGGCMARETTTAADDTVPTGMHSC